MAHPCTPRPARLGARALLAVQISAMTMALALASAEPAAADARPGAIASHAVPPESGAEAGSPPPVRVEHLRTALRATAATPPVTHHAPQSARRSIMAALRAMDHLAIPARHPVTAALRAAGHSAMPARRPVTSALRAANRPAAISPRVANAMRKRASARHAARAGRSARMVSAMLWRQHRQYRAVRLAHPQAARRLHHAGLRWRSSGRCVNRHRPTCTSLSSVRLGTLWGVVNLKRRSHCPIVVTGGTEVGHAGGAYSHGRGYKVDIDHNRCVDRFIRHRHPGQVRGDGARLYYERRPQGYTVYAHEPTHWDILFL